MQRANPGLRRHDGVAFRRRIMCRKRRLAVDHPYAVPVYLTDK